MDNIVIRILTTQVYTNSYKKKLVFVFNSQIFLDVESHKRAELRITDISNFVSDDWINLAHELGFQSTDIAQIQKEYPDSSGQQCMSMLNLWMNEISGQDSGKLI